MNRVINVHFSNDPISFDSIKLCNNRINYSSQIPRQLLTTLRLQLHGAIHRPDSFVLMLRHCVNLKAIRYESTSLNRIAADKSHSVIAALRRFIMAEGEKCCQHFVSRFQFPLVSS